MISADVLKDFENTMIPGTNVPYSHICSWAVWGQAKVPATSFLDDSNIAFPPQTDELVDVLHTRVVLVGFNPGSAAKAGRGHWTSFHFGRASRDERLAEACRETPLWGCLMTDLFPLILDSESGDVDGVLSGKKAIPEGEESKYDHGANIAAFEKSLSLAGVAEDASVTLICIGGASELWAKRLLKGNRKWRSLTTCRRNYTLIRIDHYSDQNRKLIGAENKPSAYKGIVNKQLKSAKN